jgi:hypothetical protein
MLASNTNGRGETYIAIGFDCKRHQRRRRRRRLCVGGGIRRRWRDNDDEDRFCCVPCDCAGLLCRLLRPQTVHVKSNSKQIYTLTGNGATPTIETPLIDEDN